MLVAAAVTLAACVHNFRLKPGPVQWYDGPARAADSVAVLENATTMYIESVDHRSLRRYSLNEDVVWIQLLPGRHTFVAGPAERGGYSSTESLEVSFLAQTGHRYRVSRRTSGGSGGLGWDLVLTDLTTGREEAL